jgi:hypothetical protein
MGTPGSKRIEYAEDCDCFHLIQRCIEAEEAVDTDGTQEFETSKRKQHKETPGLVPPKRIDAVSNWMQSVEMIAIGMFISKAGVGLACSLGLNPHRPQHSLGLIPYAHPSSRRD